VAADKPILGPQTKRRSIAVQSGIRLDRIRTKSIFQPSWPDFTVGRNEYRTAGTQETVSEGHPFSSSKEKGKRDIGGEFFTQKKLTLPVQRQSISNVGYKPSGLAYFDFHYEGPLLPLDPSTVPFPPSYVSSNGALDAAGTTAISRVKPTNPVASLTAALAEIHRDGLPSLSSSQTWESKASVARDAGGDYLNAQFGWVPLISDVTDFTGGVSRASELIAQYKRGIGKPTRRTYHFPTTVQDESGWGIIASGTPWGPGSNIFTVGNLPVVPGKITFQRSVVQHRWFSGSFSYYFPSSIFGSKKLADYAILAHELGLEPTPEVLWQVTPWSWAVDWFSNTGDCISNWTAFHVDGLVMLYGYMMEHTIVTDTYSMTGFAYEGNPCPVQDLVKVTETKIRRGATPYGFGLNWNGFSSFQGSILAALGLNKGLR